MPITMPITTQITTPIITPIEAVVPPPPPPPPPIPIFPIIPFDLGSPLGGAGGARGFRAGRLGYGMKHWYLPELVIATPEFLSLRKKKTVIRKAKEVPYGARIARTKRPRLKGIRV